MGRLRAAIMERAHPHITASAMGLAYQAVTVTVGFLLTPFLLRALGPEVFGIWALLGTLAAYESLSDLGIPAAMVILINSSRHIKERNSIITVGVAANAALTLAAIAVLLLLRDRIMGFAFRPDHLSKASMIYSYDLTLASFVFLVIARSFSSILDALQRVDVRFIIDSVGAVSFACFAWLAVRFGYGLVGMAIATLAIAVARASASSCAAFLVCREVRPSLYKARDITKRMATLGLKSQGANLGLSLSDPLLKSLISAGTGPAGVGAAQMGSSVASIPNSIAHSMIGNLFPAIACANGQQDRQSIDRLASRYLVLVACILIPATGMVVTIGDDLIRLWLGGSYPDVQLSLKITALAFAFRAMAMVPWRVSWGLGRPQDSSIAMVLHLGVLAGGGAFLIGISASSLANLLYVFLLSYGISSSYLLWCLFRNLEGFWAGHIRHLAKSLALIGIVSTLTCVGYSVLALGLAPVAQVVVAGIVTMVAILACLVFTLSAEERVGLLCALRLLTQRALSGTE